MRKKSMALKIICGKVKGVSTISVSQMFVQADRMKNQLTTSYGLSNFVYTINISGKLKGDKDDMRKERKLFQQRYGNDAVVRTFALDTRAAIRIYNSKCAENGWRVNWLLPQSY